MKLRFIKNTTTRRAVVYEGAVVEQEETGWGDNELADAIEHGSCEVVLDAEPETEDEGTEDDGDPDGEDDGDPDGEDDESEQE